MEVVYFLFGRVRTGGYNSTMVKEIDLNQSIMWMHRRAVVVDEAHRMRNKNSALLGCLQQVRVSFVLRVRFMLYLRGVDFVVSPYGEMGFPPWSGTDIVRFDACAFLVTLFDFRKSLQLQSSYSFSMARIVEIPILSKLVALCLWWSLSFLLPLLLCARLGCV